MPVPTAAPITVPATPTNSPSAAIAVRWDDALEPSSLRRAIERARPATMVAKVLAVMMAPT